MNNLTSHTKIDRYHRSRIKLPGKQMVTNLWGIGFTNTGDNHGGVWVGRKEPLAETVFLDENSSTDGNPDKWPPAESIVIDSFGNTHVVFGGELRRYDKDGVLLEIHQFPAQTSLDCDATYLWGASRNGWIYRLLLNDYSNPVQWAFDPTGQDEAWDVAVTDNHVYVAWGGQRTYKLNKSDASVVWGPATGTVEPNAHLWVALDPDGNAWSSGNVGYIKKFDADTGNTLVSFSRPGSNDFAKSGIDAQGHLWLPAGNDLYHYDENGTLIETFVGVTPGVHVVIDVDRKIYCSNRKVFQYDNGVLTELYNDLLPNNFESRVCLIS